MSGMESYLLRFSKVIIDILIQCHSSDKLDWYILFWPKFRSIKNVKIEFKFIFFINNLQTKLIDRIIAIFNCLI